MLKRNSNFANALHKEGQAIIESIIAISTVLLSMVVLIPLLGKYVETSQKTEQASRYAAWERTVWFASRPADTTNAAVKSEDAIEREIHWRFFSNDQSIISSDDGDNNRRWQTDQNLNPMLATRQTDGFGTTSLIAEVQQGGQNYDQIVRLSTRDDEPTGIARLFNNFMRLFRFGGFTLNTRGLHSARVQYEYSPLPGVEPFEQALNITPNSELFILADGWNTSGRAHTVAKVRGLMPSNLANNGVFNTARNLLGSLPVAREIRTSQLRFGHVDTEQVPRRRLCRLRGNRCR